MRGDHECATGLTCVGYTAAEEGTCQTPPAIDAACGPGEGGAGGVSTFAFSDHPSCADGAYCSDGRCVARVAEGGNCFSVGGEESMCEASLVCVRGKCAAKFSAQGEPCDTTSDCVTPLFCEGVPSGTCEPLKGAGGTCTGGFGFATECSGRCDAEGGESGTCVSFCGSP